jgi:hypothetical protein
MRGLSLVVGVAALGVSVSAAAHAAAVFTSAVAAQCILLRWSLECGAGLVAGRVQVWPCIQVVEHSINMMLAAHTSVGSHISLACMAVMPAA